MSEQSAQHPYTSTACHHDLHHNCRQFCKFCAVACRCVCHISDAPTPEKAV